MDFSIFTPFDLSTWQWIVWFGFGLSVGLTKTGFSGLSAAIIPFIAIIFGARQSTGLLLPVLCFADILAVVYYHRHSEIKYVFKLIPWTVAGFALAILVDSIIPVQAFKYFMGGCILVGLIIMIWNENMRKNLPPHSSWWFSAIFGIAGGFSTMFGNVAGPIMAVFLLSMRLPKNSFVGTTAWFFLIVNLLKLPIMIFVWKTISVQTLLFDLTQIPMVVAGAGLGIFLIKKISESLFRKIIIILTLMSTVLLFI